MLRFFNEFEFEVNQCNIYNASNFLFSVKYECKIKGSPPEKKCLLPGIARKGGGGPCPNFFNPFFHPSFPLYFGINIMSFDTFWSFLTP